MAPELASRLWLQRTWHDRLAQPGERRAYCPAILISWRDVRPSGPGGAPDELSSMVWGNLNVSGVCAVYAARAGRLHALTLHAAVGCWARWALGGLGGAAACQSGAASTACAPALYAAACVSYASYANVRAARVDSARGIDILAFSGWRAVRPRKCSWGSTEPKRHQTVSNHSAFLR